MNSTLCFEKGLSNFLSWPHLWLWWLHGKHKSTTVNFDVLSDRYDFEYVFLVAGVESSKV